jgi:hypothetical protein
MNMRVTRLRQPLPDIFGGPGHGLRDWSIAVSAARHRRFGRHGLDNAGHRTIRCNGAIGERERAKSLPALEVAHDPSGHFVSGRNGRPFATRKSATSVASRSRTRPRESRQEARQRADHRGRRARAGDNHILRLEGDGFVLLLVLVVANRQAPSASPANRQKANRLAGLAAHQLERIGILFCGIRLEPVATLSSISKNRTSSPENRITSSASRLRCTIAIEQA